MATRTRAAAKLHAPRAVPATCELGPRPRTDNSYFEQMAKIVFRIGLSRELIDRKWPAFRKAFAGFAISKVAAFKPADVARLMRDESIVRNERKIAATVENARAFAAVRAEHGSFARYLRAQAAKGERELCKDLGKRFSFMGPASALFFLRLVGEEMPVTMQLRARGGRRV